MCDGRQRIAASLFLGGSVPLTYFSSMTSPRISASPATSPASRSGRRQGLCERAHSLRRLMPSGNHRPWSTSRRQAFRANCWKGWASRAARL